MKYSRNVDVLNEFFGLNLGGWWRGEYHSHADNYRKVWFPYLAYYKNGKLVPGHPYWFNELKNDVLIVKPVCPTAQYALKKWEEACWRNPKVEIALFARTKNGSEWTAQYYGIYRFVEGNQTTGKRIYKRMEKQIDISNAADWLAGNC